METIPALLPLCEGNLSVTSGFSSQRDSNVEYSEWNLDQNADIFIKQSPFENVHSIMMAILLKSKYINSSPP